MGCFEGSDFFLKSEDEFFSFWVDLFSLRGKHSLRLCNFLLQLFDLVAVKLLLTLLGRLYFILDFLLHILHRVFSAYVQLIILLPQPVVFFLYGIDLNLEYL